ncbi:MAG: radical SAM/SPASM domain-containing protein [Armatimonadota bacterium]
MSKAEIATAEGAAQAVTTAAGTGHVAGEEGVAGLLTRLRSRALVWANVAHVGLREPALRPWFLGNRLRQLSVGLQCHARHDGWSSPRRSVSLRVTLLCNANCRMCAFANTVDPDSGRPITSRAGFIDLDLACRLAGELAPSHSMLNLTGGEPLVWGDKLFDLIDHCRKRGVPTTVTTNGTYLGRHLDRLLESPPQILIVSVLGGEAVHDGIVRIPAYARMRDALLELLERKQGDRWRSPIVLTNTVMLAENVSVFPGVVALSRELGACGASFQPVWFAPDSSDGGVQSEAGLHATLGSACATAATHVAPGRGLWESWQRALELSVRLHQPVFIYPRLSRADAETYYSRPDHPVLRTRALCGHLFAHVLPDGALGVCPGQTLGNLHEHSLGEIWNAGAMREFRLRLKRAGMFSACSRCCQLWRYD